MFQVHPTIGDKELRHEEDVAHRPSSRASSIPKSKAGSEKPIVHEEPDLVLPATASTYNHSPEPSPEVPLTLSNMARLITDLFKQ